MKGILPYFIILNLANSNIEKGAAISGEELVIGLAISMLVVIVLVIYSYLN